MQLAYALPWWLAAVIVAAVGILAFLAYRRPLAPLTTLQRGVLRGLRALTLLALALFLFRPVVLLPPAITRGAVVPLLVDVSRSMRLEDADGEARITRASAIASRLIPALSGHFDVALFAVGDAVAPAQLGGLRADSPRSDLAASLASVREKYRGQPVAGIVVISDGGDTSQSGADVPDHGPPVFAVGVGSVDAARDREILGATVGDPKLDQTSVDLRVSAISSGFGRTPFQLRLLANGALVETRRVVPPSEGSPIEEMFTVSPDAASPTVFTAEITQDESEAVIENNSRSVLVSPAGRRRRILVIEGAPGFEHSFMKRALMLDPGLEIDSVTRKGKNADGKDTFFVQSGAGGAAKLTSGFPSTREDLYAYDALVIANVEGGFFTRSQLAMTADFVAERGGGLLVLGGRSFDQRGLMETPLEVALPVELNSRRGVATASLGGRATTPNKLVVTPEGENHPIMRIGDTPEQTRRIWQALPALAASAPLGGARPGATVLAVAAVAGGGLSPMVAVQRFGQGRSMVFAGEASWRWKMMLASTDRTFELFWRHAARWLAGPAPDPVTISVPDAPEPGDAVGIAIDARDAAFTPVADATVDAMLTAPGGTAQPLKLKKADAAARFTASFRPDRPGLYRVQASARRGTAALGEADRWMYVGGADREFGDPRLNEGFLQRMARISGGRYVRAADAMRIGPWLQSGVPQSAAPERRDLWHEPWAFALIVVLLGAEWTLRRRWGLR